MISQKISPKSSLGDTRSIRKYICRWISSIQLSYILFKLHQITKTVVPRCLDLTKQPFPAAFCDITKPDKFMVSAASFRLCSAQHNLLIITAISQKGSTGCFKSGSHMTITAHLVSQSRAPDVWFQKSKTVTAKMVKSVQH